MSRLSGLDVVVVRDLDGDALHRCLAQLAAQRRQPASVTVIGAPAQASDASIGAPAVGPGPAGGERTPGDAMLPLPVEHRTVDADVPRDLAGVLGGRARRPWTLVLRSSDGLGRPDALVELEALTDVLPEGAAALLRAVPSPGRAAAGLTVPSTAAISRPLLHRGWSGWGTVALPLDDWATLVGNVARWPSVRALEVAETLLTPFGSVAPPAAAGIGPIDDDPVAELTVIGVGGPLELAPQRLVHGDAARPPRADVGGWTVDALADAAAGAARPWLAFIDAFAAAAILDDTFVAKCRLRRHAGVRLVLMVPAAEAGPRWQHEPFAPGDELTVTGICCRADDLVEVVRGASARARSPRWLGASWARSRPSGAGRPSPRTRSPSALRAATSGCAAGSARARAGGCLEPGTVLAGGAVADHPLVRAPLAPTGSVPLELVGDPVSRLVGLSTPLAPLPATSWPARVLIGSVDRLPYPGTVPIRRAPGGTDDEPLAPFRYGPGPDGELLGYFVVTALADSASVHDRWTAALADLRHHHGVDARGARVPEAIAGLVLSRRPSSLPAVATDEAWPTFVVDLPSGSCVAGHPDVVPAGARLGLVTRVGPAIPRRPDLDRRPVAGPVGAVGFARSVPSVGDAPEGGAAGRWYGQRPSAEARLLVRWRTPGAERYTTGELPRRFARGRLVADDRAELLGTLGWCRPPTGGATDLVELYHPRRDAWMVTADPAAARAHGYVEVRSIGSLDHERSPMHVRLWSSYDRVRRAHRLHLVAREAGDEPGWANGWLQLATTPPVTLAGTVAPAGHDRPSARTGDLRSTPWPGATLVVAMAHEHRAPTTTTDPWRYVAHGWACCEVVGYVTAGADEVAAMQAQAVADLALLADRSAVPLGARARLLGRTVRRSTGAVLARGWGRRDRAGEA